MALVSKVELFVKCKGLKDADITSKSDPFAALKCLEGPTRGMDYGRTETQQNQLNPVFQKTFLVEYYFEQKQVLQLTVNDQDDQKLDVLGSVTFELGHVMGARGSTLQRPLGSNNGTVEITGVPVNENN